MKLKLVVYVFHVVFNRYNLASVCLEQHQHWIMLSWVCWVFQQIIQLPCSLTINSICELPPQTCSKDIFLALERRMKVKGWIKVWLKCLHLFLKASLLYTSAAVFVFMAQRQMGEDTLPFCSSHWLVKTEAPRAMPATTGRQSDANSFTNTIAHIPKTHILHLTHTLFCLIYRLVGVWQFFFLNRLPCENIFRKKICFLVYNQSPINGSKSKHECLKSTMHIVFRAQ